MRGTQLTLDLTSTNTQEDTMNPTARAVAFAEALTDRFRPGGHVFSVMPGRKNHRIVKTDKYGNGESVHAFVDAEGNVYKPNGWKAPAAGIRARVRTDAELAELINSLTEQDWAGGYLYR